MIKKESAVAGGHEIFMETGRMANQADGAVWIQCGDTVVLVTAVTQVLGKETDFMPLTVEYREMSYAAGRIPGGFFRREIGRPSERETLTSRLIDRPIRPLFPKVFRDEVQLIATVLSADPDVDPDVLAITAASAALHISKIPYEGPIAGARIGYVDDRFVLNPSAKILEKSIINVVIAASRDAVVMVEGGAKFAPFELLAEAIEWGHKQIQPLIDMQENMRASSGKPKIELVYPEKDPQLHKMVRSLYYPELQTALSIKEKMSRREAKKEVRSKLAQTIEELSPESPDKQKAAREVLEELEKEILRRMVNETGKRIDGRDLTTVRPLGMEIGVLPRAHGSALFSRGETKVLAVATLGSSSDEQKIETLVGDSSKRFMLHYNFPPYCVGEVKPLRGPARREIGHGALAERSLIPVLPAQDEFPFTMRVVSEVMESNGSSSMASVCGASLALMDAGVPVKNAVAGIAMGLIKEGDNYHILTDILGDEDQMGDMDFKIAGTAEGITAVQMDIKITGIPPEVLRRALAQATEAKLNILGQMNEILASPRPKLSPYAPQLEIVHINPEKIRDVIGPGGKVIKSITAETGASIDIEDSGKVSIFAPTMESLIKARDMVLSFDQKAELYANYTGVVRKVIDCGAIVEILPGLEGLVHVSQLDVNRVEKVEDKIKLGQELKVKVIEVEHGGRIRLSRKAVLLEESGVEFDPASVAKPSGPRREGRHDGHDRGRRHDSGNRRPR